MPMANPERRAFDWGIFRANHVDSSDENWLALWNLERFPVDRVDSEPASTFLFCRNFASILIGGERSVAFPLCMRDGPLHCRRIGLLPDIGFTARVRRTCGGCADECQKIYRLNKPVTYPEHSYVFTVTSACGVTDELDLFRQILDIEAMPS
jgi:hypothetical protein